MLAPLASIISRVAAGTLSRWSRDRPKVVDAMTEMADLALDMLVETILGGGEEFRRGEARAQLAHIIAEISRHRVSYLFPDPLQQWLPRSGRKQTAALKARVERMIATRRLEPPRDDLVDHLLAAADPETGLAMPDTLLADNLLGFMAAGHDTVAVALTWSLYLLALFPEAARRVRDEVRHVAGDGPICSQHVAELVYTKQLLQEAMRLYPPAPILVRQCLDPIEINGIKIVKGKRVIIPTYAMHRHRRHWQNPDAFDPDRFAPERPVPDRYVYFPFGAGRRICVGAAFAMLELTVALATLMRSVRLAISPHYVVEPVAGIALKPRGGLPLSVTFDD
jgi:cytochrome P450